MRAVHKYTWDKEDSWTPMMPKGARVLRMGRQEAEACLWALVETKAEEERRFFQAVMTGAKVPDGYTEYLGTVLLHDGSFMVHFFEYRKD